VKTGFPLLEKKSNIILLGDFASKKHGRYEKVQRYRKVGQVRETWDEKSQRNT